MFANYKEEIFHFSSKVNLILLSLIYLSHTIKSNIIDCPKDKPFLMLESGECKQNCFNALNSNECIINNRFIYIECKIIKYQKRKNKCPQSLSLYYLI